MTSGELPVHRIARAVRERSAQSASNQAVPSGRGQFWFKVIAAIPLVPILVGFVWLTLTTVPQIP